jgi:hypothetical protein
MPLVEWEMAYLSNQYTDSSPSEDKMVTPLWTHLANGCAQILLVEDSESNLSVIHQPRIASIVLPIYLSPQIVHLSVDGTW